MVKLVLSALVALLIAGPTARAQRADSTCDYARCALNILPRLTALDVVRGDAGQRVGSLAFLFPRDVAGTFAGDGRASAAASRALRRRRVAAVLTDVGIALVAVGGIRRSPGAAGAGIAMVASSVPIHFSADAELSRAVWEFNRRFSR